MHLFFMEASNLNSVTVFLLLLKLTLPCLHTYRFAHFAVVNCLLSAGYRFSVLISQCKGESDVLWNGSLCIV